MEKQQEQQEPAYVTRHRVEQEYEALSDEEKQGELGIKLLSDLGELNLKIMREFKYSRMGNPELPTE